MLGVPRAFEVNEHNADQPVDVSIREDRKRKSPAATDSGTRGFSGQSRSRCTRARKVGVACMSPISIWIQCSAELSGSSQLSRFLTPPVA